MQQIIFKNVKKRLIKLVSVQKIFFTHQRWLTMELKESLQPQLLDYDSIKTNLRKYSDQIYTKPKQNQTNRGWVTSYDIWPGSRLVLKPQPSVLIAAQKSAAEYNHSRILTSWRRALRLVTIKLMFKHQTTRTLVHAQVVNGTNK